MLVRELAALYSARATGTLPALAPLPVQYADYAAWQRSWLQGDVLQRQLDYWRHQLSGAPQALELPTDRPRPAVQSHRGSSLSSRLSRQLSDSLKALAQHEGATPFMLLLAAFQLLLSRYSGQDDIVVGSPIAGRTHAQTEGLIGFFVNTLVLRSRLDSHSSFRQLLAQVRETALGAYAHQDVPFEKLVEELHPERSLSRTPLFQVMLTLQNTPRQELSLPGLLLRGVEAGGEVAKFDLTLSLNDTPDGLAASLVYNADLFDAATAGRMLEHLRVLLEAIASHPDQRLSELPLLTLSERQQVLSSWNDTAAPRRSALLHQLIADQAARSPHVPAVMFEDSSLTFRELDTRANQLAHHLCALGVGPDVRVGLFVERSVEALIGLLGILKAGGAYVPLDTALPRERLGYMLQDSGAKVLVTQDWLVDRLPVATPAVVFLDSARAQLERQPATLPVSDVTAEHLAYVIYTSGSTGRPKGVMIQHASVVNLLSALDSAVYSGAQPPLRVSVNAPLSFDASVKQLIQLANGHTLCLISEEARGDVRLMLEQIRRYRLDVLDCSPSHLRLLLEEGLATRDEDGPSRVLIGGEAIGESTWHLLAHHPRITFFNVYGPTECTVDSTACAASSRPAGPSIGRALRNVRTYVLDAHLHPVPVGIPGELFIGGAQLARGYLDRPELTAEKFVPNPFGTEHGARLYRTGDKVRWLADGTLEYLGRFDFQVKLRGFRIELGEIEAALEQHPAVRTAVALVREDMPGNPRLVAYVVPEDEPSTRDATGVSILDLRAHLQERLPEYMVPAAFVVLPALPLTPNGKLDRKALPAPDLTAGGVSSVAPRTPTEELLAGIWSQLLGLSQVGVTDSFFELGGHSLLATQAISRIRSAFQVDLPLRALFETPTVAALAPRVDAAMRAGQGLQVPPLVPVARDAGPMPLSFPQQRLWFLDQLTPGSALYNIPMALRLEGTLDVAALEYAFEELIRRHESLRTTFLLTGEQVLQVFAPAAQAWPLGVVDLCQLPEGSLEPEVRRLASEEAMRPFDLARGPLFRSTLLRLDAQQHVLLVTVHHIVSDGWSSGVLVRELAALYSARATGTLPALAPLPVQYADYAAWQRSWLQGDVLQRQLDYWRHQLSGAPQALELPTDRPRPAVQSHRGSSLSSRLSRQLSDSLKALAQHEGATPFMLLLAAFQLLLSRYSGQDDIVVGSPIAGRTHAQTEGLIGFFVNTLVLRSRLDSHSSFRQLLAQVRETALGAYAHQDVPFEKLVEELHPERSLSRTPLFQVMLTLQNTPRQELSLPGLLLRGVEAGGEVAKFDLTLSLNDTPDGLAASLVYNADLFDAATAGRMLEHLRVLLEGIVAHPDQRLSELPLLTSTERQQVLSSWNDTAVAYRPDLFVHEQVATQAQGAPQALAIGSASDALTYGELERRANQLAHHLRALGVGPEVCVGVLLERSVDLGVSLLAVLKAGGAYLPLDTAYPRERLRFMLQDSAARVLLTRSALLERFDLGSTTTSVVCLDTQRGALDVQPAVAPAPELAADNLAYVIYTSGSSGRPKGVQISHGSLANLVAWHQRTYAVTSGDRATQLAGTAFDASVWELWPYLTAGASLHLPPEDVRTVPEALVRWLCAEGITLTFLPTPLAESALEVTWPEHSTLRALLTGGDRLRGRPRRDQGFRLVNHYGPTESTVVTTCADVAVQSSTGTLPSIGRPIDNTQVYLLDRHLRPVPPGAAGELYIGGAGLARGYLGQPALTAERFVPNPFSATPGERLYRSGDRVRALPDGSLEYLGRLDEQVKVRGLRIELGEIEWALAQHPAVREAVVLARQDPPGDKRLVAYVVPAPGTATAPSLTVEELRAHLRQRLPEYMVPSAFCVLESLPLTPNGKVDRKALPAPDAASAGLDRYEAPRDELEARLVALWEEMLGVQPVGVRSDFFELGGHSLLAAGMMARIRERFGRALPVATLFQGATVELLARRLREEAVAPPDAPVVSLNTDGTRPPFFCVHAVGGDVLSYAALARALGPEQPFHALRAPGIDGAQEPMTSIEALAARHLETVRRLQPHGPYRLGGWSFGGVVALEMARQLQDQGARVDTLALIDSHLPPTRHDAPAPSAEDLQALFFRDLVRTSEERVTLASEQLQPLRRVFESHMMALRRYTPRTHVGRLLLFRAAEHLEREHSTSDRGFAALATAGVDVEVIPGDHYTLLQPPQVENLAKRLAEYLERSSAVDPNKTGMA